MFYDALFVHALGKYAHLLCTHKRAVGLFVGAAQYLVGHPVTWSVSGVDDVSPVFLQRLAKEFVFSDVICSNCRVQEQTQCEGMKVKLLLGVNWLGCGSTRPLWFPMGGLCIDCNRDHVRALSVLVAVFVHSIPGSFVEVVVDGPHANSLVDICSAIDRVLRHDIKCSTVHRLEGEFYRRGADERYQRCVFVDPPFDIYEAKNLAISQGLCQ